MMDMNHIEKKQFVLEKYALENGKSIPVTLGYETYGEMNEDKSNVILVAHYFSGSSHAAGKYTPEDPLAGYWDGLIGPGKAVDTDKFFVISTDNLANVQAKNPKVVTTGPRSVNPETGERWGLDFPAFTYRDMAGIQQEFLTEQLGIEKLYAVMGGSAGGFIAQHWAVNYPEKVERMIGVVTNPQNPIMTSLGVAEQAMQAIELDPAWQDGFYEETREPVAGLHLAVQMMNTAAFTPEFYEGAYKRAGEENEQDPYSHIGIPAVFQRQMHEAVAAGATLADASHWYYTCRATMMHDIAHGFDSLEEALDQITAKVLMISSSRDLLQPPVFSRQMTDTLKDQGKEAAFFEFDSLKGHMGGILDTHLFSEKIEVFLK